MGELISVCCYLDALRHSAGMPANEVDLSPLPIRGDVIVVI